MKTVSNTLLLSIAVALIGMNLHCNKIGGSTGGAASSAGAQSEAFDRTSAYLSVSDRGSDSQEKLEMMTRTCAHLAMADSVLRRAVNDDKTEDGRKLDRIRKTSYFAGELNETIRNLQSDLKVTAVRGTNLIRISLRSAPPKERPEILNAVADALVRHAAQMHKQAISNQMKNVITRLEELRSSISARQKNIQQICGMSDAPILNLRGQMVNNSLSLLTNELMSLRLQKTRAESDLESLKEQKESGKPIASPEVKLVVASDPSVAELRSALLKAKISALGNGGDKKLIGIQRSLATMLAEREKAAAEEAVQFMLDKAEVRVTNVSEQLLAVGNQYNESAAMMKDLQVSLQKIETLQSQIDRLEGRAEEMEVDLLKMRIALGVAPLHVRKVADLP